MVGVACGGPAAQAAAAAAVQPDFSAVEMKLCGVFVKQYWLQRDGEHDAIAQHRHDSDHVTAVAVGSVEVWCDGINLGIRHAPALVAIPAGSRHHFRAVTPQALLYCIHQLDEGQDQPSYERV